MEKNNKNDKPLLWKTLGIGPSVDKNIADSAYWKMVGVKKDTGQVRLAWKILRDPYFGSVYKIIKSTKKIFEAGFFEDIGGLENSNQDREDTNWLATPTYKISRRLDQVKNHNKESAKPYIVLLSTGAFSPIHDGHLQMMEMARKEMEERGFDVIGGYISPSHDGYVSIKNGGEAALQADLRIDLCRRALSESDWLMADPWEALHADYALNYTDVLIRLEKYLNVHLKADRLIEVVYVFGSDNVNFARAFAKKGRCVCVKRRGYEKSLQTLQKEKWLEGNNRVVFSKGFSGTIDISSSSIRKGSEMLNNELEELYKRYISRESKVGQKNCLYQIRDDSDWATSFWKNQRNLNNLKVESGKLLNGLADLFERGFRENSSLLERRPLLCFLSAKRQDLLVRKINKQDQVISLDACCRGKFNLEVSRVFAISDDQQQPESRLARPGCKSLDKQVKKIPKGEYILVEDDVASGATIEFVYNLLGRLRVVKKLFILSKESPVAFFGDSKKNNSQLPVFDLVDFRDFLVGSKGGGLVVYLPNGEIARAPYMMPYVSLTTRAKLPVPFEVEASRKIWEMNEEFFQGVKPVIRLKDSDASFQKLMLYVGFAADTPLEEICNWHKNKLR